MKQAGPWPHQGESSYCGTPACFKSFKIMDQYIAFPFLKSLEDSWEDVLEELNNLLYNEAENQKSYFKPWHEVQIYEGQWDVYGLYSSGKKLNGNCERCPKTTSLIESVPGMVNAGFSALSPETHIRPHTGCDERLLRCHLGLITPKPLPDYDRRATGVLTAKTCGLRVDDDFYYWEPGKSFVFDETIENEAWNWGDRTRFILIIDFKKESSKQTAENVNSKSALGDMLALGMPFEKSVGRSRTLIRGTARQLPDSGSDKNTVSPA